MKLPFETNKPVGGEASVEIDRPLTDVFRFVGERFFENYPKWAVEVAEFESLDGQAVFVGAKGKQVRTDNGAAVESVFAITDYKPYVRLSLEGVEQPYRQSYLLEGDERQSPTRLTFRFELTHLEVFMRPFEKLIRYAIEDGAENTVANIKNLIAAEAD